MVKSPCRPALLAAQLTRCGAAVVVVGGTARWLRSGGGRPRDLDVVVDPLSVPALVRALAALGVAARVVAVLRCRDVRFDTGWGPLDVFVDDCPPSTAVLVEGVPVAVMVAE